MGIGEERRTMDEGHVNCWVGLRFKDNFNDGEIPNLKMDGEEFVY